MSQSEQNMLVTNRTALTYLLLECFACVEIYFISFYCLVDAPLPSHYACENKELMLTCGKGKSIKIISANYGRQVSTTISMIIYINK